MTRFECATSPKRGNFGKILGDGDFAQDGYISHNLNPSWLYGFINLSLLAIFNTIF